MGWDLRSLEVTSTDTAFGFVSSSRITTVGKVAAKAVTQPPAGDGSVEIVVNGQTARAAVVNTFGLSAAQVNTALVADLIANGFDASLDGGEIVVTEDLVLEETCPNRLAWDTDDSAITDIGVTSVSPAPEVTGVPTLGEWGILLLMGLLGAAGLWKMGRRARPATG